MPTAISKRFPHLVKESISYADTVDLWHQRIKTHFKNNQFRNKENVPEILKGRRSNQKIKLSDEDDAGPSRKMRCWGISNFLPEILEREDDFTIKNYQRILNKQHNYPAHKHNGELIDRLIKNTFSHKQQVLGKDMIRLSELFQMYLILCSDVFLILLL